MEMIRDEIDGWYIAPLTMNRGASLHVLQSACEQAAIEESFFFSSIQQAYIKARETAIDGDRLIIFGSFYTVSAILRNEL